MAFVAKAAVDGKSEAPQKSVEINGQYNAHKLTCHSSFDRSPVESVELGAVNGRKISANECGPQSLLKSTHVEDWRPVYMI